MFSRDLNVKPQFKDKYYVYALCRPNGIPFYIGKGKGNRVNSHFYKSTLKPINHKTKIIKKYGSLIKREILCYFDNEESAYNYEEWLISQYGVEAEGGILTNTVKSQEDQKIKLATIHKPKAIKKLNVNVTKHKAFMVLRRIYYDGKSYGEVAKEFDITAGMVGLILKGRKCPDVRDKYLLTGKIPDRRDLLKSRYKPLLSHRIHSDQKLIDAFESYRYGLETAGDISKRLKIGRRYINKIFCGNCRKDLNLSEKKVYHIRTPRDVCSFPEYVEIYLDFKRNNLSVSEASLKYGVSKSCYYRIIKLQEKYSKITEYIQDHNIQI